MILEECGKYINPSTKINTNCFSDKKQQDIIIYLKQYIMGVNTPDEGKLTVVIEEQTSKVPSGVYLAVAVASMLTSLTLKCFGKKHAALFVGQWAAPLLIMGVYNKIVKTQGHN